MEKDMDKITLLEGQIEYLRKLVIDLMKRQDHAEKMIYR
jgi:hypothetical protein